MQVPVVYPSHTVEHPISWLCDESLMLDLCPTEAGFSLRPSDMAIHCLSLAAEPAASSQTPALLGTSRDC